MLADKDLKSFWENTESGAEINWKMQFKLIEKLKQIVRGEEWIVKDNGASCAVMGDSSAAVMSFNSAVMSRAA